MTLQEVFDKVIHHLLKQGKPALMRHPMATDFSCAYRGEDDTSCAVGCLIPDALYNPNMEGQAVGTGEHVIRALEKAGLLGRGDEADADMLNVLRSLQLLHDALPTCADSHAAFTAEFRKHLLEGAYDIATAYDLSTANIPTE